jgi:uncharacterized membrane protein
MEHELENLNDEKRSGYKSKKIKGLIISTVFTVISFILPISAFVYGMLSFRLFIIMNRILVFKIKYHSYSKCEEMSV